MKNIFFATTLIIWGTLSQAQEVNFECYEFTPVIDHNVKSVMLRWQKGSALHKLVNFKVTLQNKTIDEGMSRCVFKDGLSLHCVRDDGGGELTALIGEKPTMKIVFWYLGEEGSANPLSLPADLKGRRVECKKVPLR